MAQHSNKQAARNNWKSSATARLYSTGFLTFLFLLLVSVGANKSMTHDNQQAGGEKKAGAQRQTECEEGENTVTFVFEGLFYFSFPDGTEGNLKRKEGRVGILSTRNNHQNDHMLYITFEGGPSEPMLIFSHETLQSQPYEIKIYKDSEPDRDVTIKGANTHIGWGDPGNRQCPTLDNEYDFNWIIDFEHEKLHGEDIEEEDDSIRPTLVFKSGCFRTGKLSPYRYFTVKNGSVTPYGFVARTIEVVITISGREHLMVEWDKQHFPIPEGTKKINLYNVRPEHMEHILKNKMPQHQAQMNKAAAQMPAPHSDDLHIYYDDLLEVSDKKKRFYFIPDLSRPCVRVAQRRPPVAIPFICFGAGGSKN